MVEDLSSAGGPSARDIVIFCEAARDGDIADVRRLLDQYGRAIINCRDSIEARALTWAAFSGHRDIVELLLDRGADINAPGTYDRSALTWAVNQGHGDIVTYLLEKGADPHLEDEYGRIAADYAHQYGREDMAAEIETADARRKQAEQEKTSAAALKLETEAKAAAAQDIQRLKSLSAGKAALKFKPK